MLKTALIISGVIAAPVALYVTMGDVGTTSESGNSGFVIPNLSHQAYNGKEYFAAACGGCHGVYGEGTDKGPVLIHALYAPSDMSDEAIRSAIQHGAPSRNWPFGDMPAIDNLSNAKIEMIIGFLREVQVANNIY